MTESTTSSVSNNAEPMISIRGVGKDFILPKRTMVALDPIDLDVVRGEFLCIVGPSGCGKTTLLRILAGLEPLSTGTISFNVPSTPPGQRERPLNSMVFQEQSVFPWMTVIDNVAFGLKAQGRPRHERYALAEPLIRAVGLTGFEDALPHQLSGGMKQRVSIARAFVTDPELLLMDEPFGALDEQTKIVLQAELLRIWENTRKTVLYVTHSIDEAIVLADRVLVMSARPGRIKEIINITEIFGRPRDVESVKSSPHYGELFWRIWSQLKSEVLGASQIVHVEAAK